MALLTSPRWPVLTGGIRWRHLTPRAAVTVLQAKPSEPVLSGWQELGGSLQITVLQPRMWDSWGREWEMSDPVPNRILLKKMNE